MAAKTEKEQPQKTEKPAKAKKVFPLEKLRANCKELFGVTDSTFAGATYGMTGSYTIEEIKAKIENWQRMEVQ
jgi:hypothetical protein